MLLRLFRSLFHARSTAAAIGQGFLANGLLLVLNVVTGIITARALGPEGRGEVAALVAVPTFICFLAPLGLSPAIVYETKSRRSTPDAISAAALLLAAVLGMAAATAAAFATPWVLAAHHPDLVQTATWLAVFAIPGLLANLGIAVLQGTEQFGACNLIRLAQPTISLLALLTFSVGFGLTATEAALITLCAGFPGLLWNLWLIHPKLVPRWAVLRGALIHLYRYAVRALSGELLSGLAGQLDKIVIVVLFTPREIGLFTVAMSLSRVLLVAPQAATQVLLSRTAGRTPEEILVTVTRTGAVTLAMVVAGATVLGLSGPTVLALLYSKEFSAGAVLLQLLLLEAGLSALHQVLSQSFLSLDRPGALGVQQTAGIATSLGLLALLSGPLGILGAAWALLGGAVVRLLVALFMYPTVLGLPPPPLHRELRPSLGMLVQRLRGGTL